MMNMLGYDMWWRVVCVLMWRARHCWWRDEEMRRWWRFASYSKFSSKIVSTRKTELLFVLLKWWWYVFVLFWLLLFLLMFFSLTRKIRKEKSTTQTTERERERERKSAQLNAEHICVVLYACWKRVFVWCVVCVWYSGG